MFTVEDSTYLLDEPIIAVRQDTLSMPGGASARREIVEHFGAVAVVAYDGLRIKLIHQYRHSVGRRLWELPAGLLDSAGESPLDAAIRELQEEVGLSARRWDLLADVVSSPGFCEEAVRVYLARDLTEVDRPEPEDEEADLRSTWVDLASAVDQVMDGSICNSIAVSGILIAAQVINNGCSPRRVDEPYELRPHRLAERREKQLREAGEPIDDLKVRVTGV
ncbi:NUDIX domain-containing protein [Corynebacterium kroppenstedtii]|uniref:NUDIX domain-containing protein n=1 Tax=Corynebacterium sp. PCR 32 TaxID=3351342 RepID=UPI00309B5F66